MRFTLLFSKLLWPSFSAAVGAGALAGSGSAITGSSTPALRSAIQSAIHHLTPSRRHRSADLFRLITNGPVGATWDQTPSSARSFCPLCRPKSGIIQASSVSPFFFPLLWINLHTYIQWNIFFFYRFPLHSSKSVFYMLANWCQSVIVEAQQ